MLWFCGGEARSVPEIIFIAPHLLILTESRKQQTQQYKSWGGGGKSKVTWHYTQKIAFLRQYSLKLDPFSNSDSSTKRPSSKHVAQIFSKLCFFLVVT